MKKFTNALLTFFADHWKGALKALLSIVICLVLLAVMTGMFIVPFIPDETDAHTRTPQIMYYEGDTKPVVMENDQLRFELDPKTTYFKVIDKRGAR